MTTQHIEMKTCAVCEGIVAVVVIDSTNEYGAKDLDLRPAEMKRSTYSSWVVRCKHCGYCASDITKKNKFAFEIMLSHEYEIQNNDKFSPGLANTFLCESIILAADGDCVGAGFSCLYAAWACDDAKNMTIAKASRRRAVIHFEKAKAEGKSIIANSGQELALLADIHRRTNEYDKAEAACLTGLAISKDNTITKILGFQRHLCSKKNSKVYTVKDAIDWADIEVSILKVPYFVRLPGIGKIIDTFVIIPDGISIQSLSLSLLPTGNPTGNYEILEKIGRANNVDISKMNTMEFIALWYKEHLKSKRTPLINHDELKSFFWDALGYIKYPKGMNFHSLLDRDQNDQLCIDYVTLIDMCDINDCDIAMLVHGGVFVCTAYDEYIEVGGKTDSELSEFITRLKQSIKYESDNI